MEKSRKISQLDSKIWINMNEKLWEHTKEKQHLNLIQY